MIRKSHKGAARESTEALQFAGVFVSTWPTEDGKGVRVVCAAGMPLAELQRLVEAAPERIAEAAIEAARTAALRCVEVMGGALTPAMEREHGRHAARIALADRQRESDEEWRRESDKRDAIRDGLIAQGLSVPEARREARRANADAWDAIKEHHHRLEYARLAWDCLRDAEGFLGHARATASDPETADHWRRASIVDSARAVWRLGLVGREDEVGPLVRHALSLSATAAVAVAAKPSPDFGPLFGGAL